MANHNSQNNSSEYNTPPEDLFPVFQYDNQQHNNPPQDLYPVFQYDTPPQNTPPEVLFPSLNNPPPQNPQPNNPPPRALTEDVQYEQDMQELLMVQAEEEEERRAREEYWLAKRARREARCAYRIAHGLPRVSTSDDDSSASSDAGWVSDDSFY
jgi:hypothetical protein